MTYLLLGLFAFPVLLFLLSFVGPHLATDSSVQAKLVSQDPQAQTLFVLVHGMAATQERWDQVEQTFVPLGHVLRLSYNSARWSNADPHQIATGIGKQIDAAMTRSGARRIVIVAHSMGALLTRRAILDAKDSSWVRQVQRVVLLAGVNRGWNLSGPSPADEDPLRGLFMHMGAWGARMVNMSSLVFSFERGSPFVANLRLEWMRWVRSAQGPSLQIVQMIGDIDDIVSREDNEDVRVMASANFTQLNVRGTGHGEIVEFGAHARAGSQAARQGAYRRDKVLSAATVEFETLRAQSETQAYTSNQDVRKLIFVLHGIRDLGRWSADFETEIERRYGAERAQLAIVSPRYGYFGMGPFLFEGVRARYVRWFMDQYTETLARYPQVEPEGIRFFGHSNGTYLAMEALKTYSSMEIDRVVLAGSVVAKDFDWASLNTVDRETGKARRRVRVVRNYVGSEDWVVALFPRLFELPVAKIFDNPIGSAGFNGFDTEDSAAVENVRYVHGAHGAFESRVGEIVDFLLTEGRPEEAKREGRSWIGGVLSAWPVVIFIWLALIYAVVGLGTRVIGASPQPVWPALLAYMLLVVLVLRTV